MPVGKAAADADDEIGFEEGLVAHGAADLDAGVSGAERVIVGQAALAHVGHDDRDLQVFGQLAEFGRRVGEDDAAAQNHDGSLALHDHVHGLADGLRLGNRPGPGKRAVFGGIVIDIDHLHVERQVDEHRAGTSAAERCGRPRA